MMLFAGKRNLHFFKHATSRSIVVGMSFPWQMRDPLQQLLMEMKGHQARTIKSPKNKGTQQPSVFNVPLCSGDAKLKKPAPLESEQRQQPSAVCQRRAWLTQHAWLNNGRSWARRMRWRKQDRVQQRGQRGAAPCARGETGVDQEVGRARVWRNLSDSGASGEMPLCTGPRACRRCVRGLLVGATRTKPARMTNSPDSTWDNPS